MNEKIKTLATKEEAKTLVRKAELKEEKDKIVKLEMHDLYFLGKSFFGDDCSQNLFVYQPTHSTLESKKDKGTDYVLSCISKGVYTSKRKPFETASLHSIHLSGKNENKT